jgi:hypothetical protein
MSDRTVTARLVCEEACTKDKIAKAIDGLEMSLSNYEPAAVQVWLAGEWLDDKLQADGVSEEKAKRASFAMGQRSMLSNAFVWAAKYWNMHLQGEYEEPGEELARLITRESPEEHAELVEAVSVAFHGVGRDMLDELIQTARDIRTHDESKA